MVFGVMTYSCGRKASVIIGMPLGFAAKAANVLSWPPLAWSATLSSRTFRERSAARSLGRAARPLPPALFPIGDAVLAAHLQDLSGPPTRGGKP